MNRKNRISFDRLRIIRRAPAAPAPPPITGCAMLPAMRRLALLAALLAPALAAAQPVMFQLQNNVPAGKKPTLTVTAVVRISDLELLLTREEDGAHVSERREALKPNQSTSFAIGDGGAGRSHWKGQLTVKMAGKDEGWVSDLTFETLVVAEPKATWRYDHLDLDAHKMEFQLSRPAKSAAVEVIGEEGGVVGEGAAEYHGEAPGQWLPIAWTQRAGSAMVLKLRATDVDGFATNVQLTPWQLSIEHQEVNFASGSAVIEPSERPKLDEAYGKIVAAADRVKKYVRCTLYIAGHTDTVGSRESNQKLSIDRARAIALYFKKKGLPLPISYAGFGEEQLKVKTPDETDELRNRRVDYVLTARDLPAGAEKL